MDKPPHGLTPHLFLHFGRNAVALFFDLYAIFIREDVVKEGFDSAGRFTLGVHVFIAPDFVSAIVGIFQSRCHAAMSGILTAIVLGLARAFGEALAVSMVIGKMRAFPKSLLDPTNNLTSAIASDMGGAMDGGEFNAALWSMALLLFVVSLLFILIIHLIAARKEKI